MWGVFPREGCGALRPGRLAGLGETHEAGGVLQDLAGNPGRPRASESLGGALGPVLVCKKVN